MHQLWWSQRGTFFILPLLSCKSRARAAAIRKRARRSQAVPCSSRASLRLLKYSTERLLLSTNCYFCTRSTLQVQVPIYNTAWFIFNMLQAKLKSNSYLCIHRFINLHETYVYSFMYGRQNIKLHIIGSCSIALKAVSEQM